MTGKSKIQPRDSESSTTQDWFLQSLVNMANYDGVELGLTLSVGGLLISGTLIGGKKYFEEFGADFVSPISDKEQAESIKSSFSKYGIIYRTPESDEEALLPPVYIHLKDAKFFHNSGKPIPSNRSVLWRGRITAVDGFSLGSLSAS